MAKGATLAQIQDGVEKPILYLSKALNEHEINYGISDREGAAATWAIRACRGYLRGAQVILVTDHSSLLSLVKGNAMKSMRQQCYAMDLSEHSLTIVHRAGPSMHLADALSRCGYSKDYATSTVELVKQRGQGFGTEWCPLYHIPPHKKIECAAAHFVYAPVGMSRHE